MKLINNKLIFFILTFTLFLFALCSTSYADFSVNVNEETYTFPDLPEEVTNSTYYFIFENIGNIFVTYGETRRYYEPLCNVYSSYGYDCIFIGDTPYYKLVDGEWVAGKFTKLLHLAGFLDGNNWSKVLYSNYDIKYIDDTTKVFFQTAPVVEVVKPLGEQAIIIPQLMKEVIKVIIPVGLVILSIFLVIYLIRYYLYRSL